MPVRGIPLALVRGLRQVRNGVERGLGAGEAVDWCEEVRGGGSGGELAVI